MRFKLRLHYARLYAGGIVDLQSKLPLVSAVPISGTKELASRTPNIVWHTRSNTFVLIPLLELTHAVAQTVPAFLFDITIVRGFSISLRNFVARPSIIILYRYAKSQIEAV